LDFAARFGSVATGTGQGPARFRASSAEILPKLPNNVLHSYDTLLLKNVSIPQREKAPQFKLRGFLRSGLWNLMNDSEVLSSEESR